MLGVSLGLFLLVYLFVLLVGCVFCCFSVVSCVVYMKNSDWLVLRVLVLIGGAADLVLVLAISVVVCCDWYGVWMLVLVSLVVGGALSCCGCDCD